MKETKQKCFGLVQIIWKQTNRVEKHSIITICKIYSINIINKFLVTN